MVERIDRIEELMRDLTNRENPSVYSVSLAKKDYSSLWIAYCTLRADGRHFSVEHDDPVIALVELNRVMDSLFCPYCRNLRKGEQYELEGENKEGSTSIYSEGRE